MLGWEMGIENTVILELNDLTGHGWLKFSRFGRNWTAN